MTERSEITEALAELYLSVFDRVTQATLTSGTRADYRDENERRLAVAQAVAEAAVTHVALRALHLYDGGSRCAEPSTWAVDERPPHEAPASSLPSACSPRHNP